jgi:hypothetical protein
VSCGGGTLRYEIWRIYQASISVSKMHYNSIICVHNFKKNLGLYPHRRLKRRRGKAGKTKNGEGVGIDEKKGRKRGSKDGGGKEERERRLREQAFRLRLSLHFRYPIESIHTCIGKTLPARCRVKYNESDHARM